MGTPPPISPVSQAKTKVAKVYNDQVSSAKRALSAHIMEIMEFPDDIRLRIYYWVLVCDEHIVPVLCGVPKHHAREEASNINGNDDSVTDSRFELGSCADSGITTAVEALRECNRRNGDYGEDKENEKYSHAEEGCDRCQQVRFHDSNSHTHGNITRRLAITMVCKRIRIETLPMFYNVNTFAYGPDTPIYFERLTQLGRFHMIRRVAIPIKCCDQAGGSKVLRFLEDVIKKTEDFERNHGMLNINSTRKILRQHPAYTAGGDSVVGSFLMLRKLSSVVEQCVTTAPRIEHHDRQIVLQVPNASIFTEYKYLQYFPKVASGMGIKLKFLEGDGVGFDSINDCIWVKWYQKFQKRDTENEDNVKLSMPTSEEVARVTANLFPEAPTIILPKKAMYYRKGVCGDTERQVEWFTVYGDE